MSDNHHPLVKPNSSAEVIAFEEQPTRQTPRPHHPNTKKLFISLRWRFLFPLFTILLIISLIGSYSIAYALTDAQDDNETNDLLIASDSVNQQVIRWEQQQQTELFRIASTEGVSENVAAKNADALLRLIQPLVTLSTLDIVLVTDQGGVEILGLQRVQRNETWDYSVSEKTDLQGLSTVQTALIQTAPSSEIIRGPQGLVLLIAQPIFSPANEVMGVIAVGSRLDLALVEFQTGSGVDLTLFDKTGARILTTLPDNETLLNQLFISTVTVKQAQSSVNQIPIEAIILNGKRYQVAYQPLIVHGTTLGILGIYRPSSAAFVNSVARQVFSLFVAMVVGSMLIFGYGATARLIERLSRIQETVDALAQGAKGLRTGMVANDEIGRLATTIDTYANRNEQNLDNLTANLRLLHRENAHLTAIIESLPDGLIVLDIDGRVLLMNTAARRLVGGMRTIRNASLNQLTAAVTDTLGPALAPGLYSLGDPTRLIHQEKMLQANAAALISVTGKRLGTVVTIRDVTDEIQVQQRQEALFEKLSQEVQLPMAHVAQDAALQAVNSQNRHKAGTGDALLDFAREIARNARSMQRIVAELKEVNALNPNEIARSQTPLLLSDLIWNVAAQWKPIAEAVNIEIELQVPHEAWYILGDERRLRWALGNIVDNAIKYSLPNTQIQLIGRGLANDIGYIAVVDHGVGIQSDDLPNIFQRFYRGKPLTPDGTLITTPGTGQGLYLARHVIQTHGGEINVQSRVGIGTTIQVKLPLTSPTSFVLPATHHQMDVLGITQQPKTQQD